MTPTQRTLALLRENGWEACVVEKWVSFARIRVDAFGWGDILAYFNAKATGKTSEGPNFLPAMGVALIQTTTANNLSAREAKMRDSPHLWGWLRAGGHALLIGWAKRGPRGRRKCWTPTIKQVTL